jgi:hypothetical protein
VATLSYYLVERPGRRIGVRARRGRVTALPRWRGGSLVAASLGACVLAALFVGLLSALHPERSSAVPGLAANGAQPGNRPSFVVTGAARTRGQDTAYETAVSAWQRQIRAALRLRQLPASLRPLSPHLAKSFPPPCIHGLPGLASGECVVGDPAAARVAVLNGDSHAEMLRNAVWRAFDPRAWSIHIFARSGCGWAGAANGTVSATTCARLQAEALARIRTLHPDVILLSEHHVVTSFRSSTDIASTLAAFAHAAAKTIVLGHTPLPQSWSTCLVGSDISRCFTILDAEYRSDVRVERKLATRAGAMFVDTSAWLCAPVNGQTMCPPVVDGVPVFRDDTHVGAEYQFELIPIVRALLVSAGVPVSGPAR